MQKLNSLPRGTESFISTQGRRLITNNMADKLLLEDALPYADSWPIWTRTIVAYPQSGSAFGHNIEYSCRPTRFVLDTYEFRGLRGAALLFEDFDIWKDNGTCIFMARGKPIVLESFPQESGWYGRHEPSGIPILKGSGDKRFLCRLEGARVGAVVRDYGPEGKQKLDVFLHHRPSLKLGAILEEPAESNVYRLDTALRK